MAVIPEFVVTIPVKPYVKRFIELSYGLPVDFSKYPEIQEKVNRCLKKPCTQYDNKYKTFKLSTYSENIEIVISKHYFDRYGCEFSITDSIKFGQYFEFAAKYLMKDIVDMSLSYGKTLKTTIIEIREMLGFDESQWKYESILKYIQRHNKKREKQQISTRMKKYNETTQVKIFDFIHRISIDVFHDSKLITDKYFENITERSVGKKDRLPPKKTHHEKIE